MKVRSGWSLQYATKKFDVELEDHDVIQLLQERGIPMDRQGELTVRERFMVAWDEAEIISATTRCVETGAKPAEDQLVLALFRRQHATLSRIRTRLGLEEKSD